MSDASDAAGGREELLFLCQTLPYPPDSGVTMRSFNLVRQLSEEFRVTVVCFYRRDLLSGELQANVDALSRYASDVRVSPIPQEYSDRRLIWDHLRSLLTGRVYTYFSYSSKEFVRHLDYVLGQKDFTLIHVDSLDLSRYLPRLLDAEVPVVCGHHNVESELLARRAEVEDSVFRSLYLRIQARLMEREERRYCERVDLNLTVSERDRSRLSARTGTENFLVIPNGIDVESFRPEDHPRSEDLIVSIGGVEWFPNADGLDFFCRDVLPWIRAAKPDVEIRWLGRAHEELRSDYRREFGVNLTGYVEDVRPHLLDAGCFVVPLRVGSGTRLKILTAWAVGCAVVSTSVGCEGLDVSSGEQLLVRDDPKEFAEAVCEVLEDTDLRRRLGSRARRLVEERYAWEVIGSTLRAEYRELVG